jgi:hypothetical protein
MFADKRVERLGFQQWHIARKYDHEGLRTLKVTARGHDRVAGSALFSLSDKLCQFSKFFLNSVFDFRSLMAHDHVDFLWMQRHRGSTHMSNKRQASDFVKDLRARRFHSRP